MVTVLFHSESHFPVDKDRIRRKIEEALARRVKRRTEVSVTVIGDRRMRQLNRQYRGIDATTDVLSFALNDPSIRSKTPFAQMPDDVLRLGDIVISYPQAVAEAAEENKLVDDVIDFLALHGLDHLLGVHHPE